MRLSLTLSLYIARIYLFWIAVIFVILAGLFSIIDLIELLRRTSGKADITFDIVIQMNLFKLPALFQEMLPFVVLFGSIFAFWRLARSSELVIIRAAGVSIWQFLMPAMICALLVGVFQITSFNPLAATLRGEYESLENRYLKSRENQSAIFKTDLWLRQGNNTSQQILHAKRALDFGFVLEDVSVFLLTPDQGFASRIEAERASLHPGVWVLENAVLSDIDGNIELADRYSLRTDLTIDKIQESFISPASLSFWDLPEFVATLENAGFNADAHRLRYHSLLATPLLFCAMVLIAATFSMRFNRRANTGYLFLAGLGCGFLLYFLSNVVHALGLSTGIPVILAAWMPAGVTTLMGVTALLHLEDG